MLLYIHGFLSSSQSTKAQQLKQWLAERGRDDEWLCPDLSANPLEAMATLSQIIEKTIEQNRKKDNGSSPKMLKLVGSSLGGFYATCLSERYNLKAVLINPSTNPAQTLASRIGTHKAWHSEDEVEFTHDDVEALQQMRPTTIDNPDNFLLMIEKNDETLDYRLAIERYQDCNQLIFNHGDHSFTRFKQVLELIDRF